MNDYSNALEFLGKQEGGAEHKEAVLAYVRVVLEESKDKQTKLRDAIAKLKRLSESAGSTEEELENKLSDLQRQVKDLTTERDKLKTTTEADTKELEGFRAEKVQREKETKMRSLAEKAGADYEAFNQLFGDLPVELVGETVTVKEGDKSLSLDEYLQAQPAWKKAALFSNQQESQNNKLPGAPPSGNQAREGGYLGDAYINSRYNPARFGKK